jgi:carboxyl-terminal PDZ ligand of neuronal nitric oxide synthase protein
MMDFSLSIFHQQLDDSNKENSREIQQLREQLQQQTLQTKQALAQLLLLKEQLMSEQNARIEAQVKSSQNFFKRIIKHSTFPQQQRTQQLLQQNRELLEHIGSLSGLTDAERPGLTPGNIGIAPQVGNR